MDHGGSDWELMGALFQALLFLWPLWMLLVLPAGGRLLLAWYERRRLLRSGIGEIDRMDGLTFEQYLVGLFRRLGYQVERTRFRGDYGADLVVRKAGARTVVQAKRSRGRIGVRAVQEVVAARRYYGGLHALVVTNSHFTAPARALAEANGVELWDRERLIAALLHVRH